MSTQAKHHARAVAPVSAVCATFATQPSAYPLGAEKARVAPSSAYELMHEKDFPALQIGNRIVVPKEAFIHWVEQHTGTPE